MIYQAIRMPSLQGALVAALEPGSDELTSAPQCGVMVASVDPSGSAADSGIEKSDIIVKVQQAPISDVLQTLSAEKLGYAVVLIKHNDDQTWIPIAIPQWCTVDANRGEIVAVGMTEDHCRAARQRSVGLEPQQATGGRTVEPGSARRM